MKYLILFMPFACLGEIVDDVRAFAINEFIRAERMKDELDEEQLAIYHFVRGRSSAFSDVIYFIDHQGDKK